MHSEHKRKLSFVIEFVIIGCRVDMIDIDRQLIRSFGRIKMHKKNLEFFFTEESYLD